MRQIIVVAGPTAVGKTKYAIEIAKAVDGQIVSCDSMQLYQYMNIGSAKPTAEECAEVKHYLVDEIDPKEPFSAAKYQQLAKSAINEIFSLGKVPVISGGTGLYLNTLLYNMDFSNAPQNPELRKTLEKEAELFGAEYLYKKLQEIDPKAAERIHPNNVKKVIRALEGASTGNSITDFKNCQEKCKDYETILIGLTRNRDELYDRINKRVDIMVEQGLIEEVKALVKKYPEFPTAMQAIGYKEIVQYLNNELTKEEAIEKIKQETRRYAKRQITWFKRIENLKWIDGLENTQNNINIILEGIN